MTFSSSVGSSSLGSTHRSARHRQVDHGRHPLGFPGDAVVMAAVVATFALFLSSTRPAGRLSIGPIGFRCCSFHHPFDSRPPRRGKEKIPREIAALV